MLTASETETSGRLKGRPRIPARQSARGELRAEGENKNSGRRRVARRRLARRRADGREAGRLRQAGSQAGRPEDCSGIGWRGTVAALAGTATATVGRHSGSSNQHQQQQWFGSATAHPPAAPEHAARHGSARRNGGSCHRASREWGQTAETLGALAFLHSAQAQPSPPGPELLPEALPSW